MAVGVIERGRGTPCDGQSVFDRQLALPGQPLAQSFPGDVGHDVVEQPVGHAGVEQL